MAFNISTRILSWISVYFCKLDCVPKVLDSTTILQQNRQKDMGILDCIIIVPFHFITANSLNRTHVYIGNVNGTFDKFRLFIFVQTLGKHDQRIEKKRMAVAFQEHQTFNILHLSLII